jgi:hypothetical protein
MNLLSASDVSNICVSLRTRPLASVESTPVSIDLKMWDIVSEVKFDSSSPQELKQRDLFVHFLDDDAQYETFWIKVAG